MKEIIKKIFSKNQIDEITGFLISQFADCEKPYYGTNEFLRAKDYFNKSDICDSSKLILAVSKKSVDLYGVYDGEELVASFCLNPVQNKIVFIVAKDDSKKESRFRFILDYLTTNYQKSKESFVLTIASFLNNVNTLEKIGFIKIRDYYLVDHFIKLWPMRCIVHQIDIER